MKQWKRRDYQIWQPDSKQNKLEIFKFEKVTEKFCILQIA